MNEYYSHPLVWPKSPISSSKVQIFKLEIKESIKQESEELKR
jgi:hypothetical protein